MLHDAARRAAGSRRVDEAGELVPVHLRDGGLAGGHVRRMGGDEGLPVVELDIARLPARKRLDADDMLADVRPDRRREERPRQLLGRDDDGAGAAVVEDMLVVALGVGRVGGDGDAARRHDGEIGDAPFRPVLADQHHQVARLQPDRLQPRRQRGDLLRRVPPADRPPGAFALGPQERRIALRRRAGEEHRHQVREGLELARRAHSGGRSSVAARTMFVTSPASLIPTPSLLGSAAPTQRPSTRSTALALRPSGAT